MSVRLYIKDTTDGTVHEYGTDRNDCLFVQEDGSLLYINMHNGSSADGTYAFCFSNGDEPSRDFEGEGLLDIGGNLTGEVDE